MAKNVEKAFEITNAKISFVSLVDRAANMRQFLLTKAEDGKAPFLSSGRILKADAESHFVTGVVYEPLVEDVHGNFMTEDEITKAAHWFLKNSSKVDLQHSFDPLPGASVVESWIAKSDFDINGGKVQKGTWLMTMEVDDAGIWDAIQKGELTGFSMGGFGDYSEEDVDVDNLRKSDDAEKKGIFKKFAELFGFDVVEKGEVADKYKCKTLASQFWNAFDALEDTLRKYDWHDDKFVYEHDPAKIKEALSEFSNIITDVLSNDDNIDQVMKEAPAPVEKAGKAMSAKNLATLSEISQSLDTFIKGFNLDEDEDEAAEGTDGAKNKDPESDDDEEGKVTKSESTEKEGIDMNKSDIEAMVSEMIQKAMHPETAPETEQTQEVTKSEEPEAITAESIQKMVDEAITKALQPVEKEEEKSEEAITPEMVSEMVAKSVEKAVAPILKMRGLPSNLNEEDGAEVAKSAEPHYLQGIL